MFSSHPPKENQGYTGLAGQRHPHQPPGNPRARRFRSKVRRNQRMRRKERDSRQPLAGKSQADIHAQRKRKQSQCPYPVPNAHSCESEARGKGLPFEATPFKPVPHQGGDEEQRHRRTPADQIPQQVWASGSADERRDKVEVGPVKDGGRNEKQHGRPGHPQRPYTYRHTLHVTPSRGQHSHHLACTLQTQYRAAAFATQ